MYVWQMSDGNWHISKLTSVADDRRMDELAGIYETRTEAETALSEWRERYPDAIKYRW